MRRHRLGAYPHRRAKLARSEAPSEREGDPSQTLSQRRQRRRECLQSWRRLEVPAGQVAVVLAVAALVTVAARREAVAGW